MGDRPVKPPWEAELEAAALAEEYARRGEQFSTAQPAEPPPFSSAVDAPATTQTGDKQVGGGTGLDAETEERLAKEFEIEFLEQQSGADAGRGWFAGYLATNEGRIVLITVIACVLLVLVGWLLSSSLASRLPDSSPEPQSAAAPGRG